MTLRIRSLIVYDTMKVLWSRYTPLHLTSNFIVKQTYKVTAWNKHVAEPYVANQILAEFFTLVKFCCMVEYHQMYVGVA